VSRYPNLPTRNRGQDLDSIAAVDGRVRRFTTQIVAIDEDTRKQANISLCVEYELEKSGMQRIDGLDAFPNGTTIHFDLARTVGGSPVATRNVNCGHVAPAPLTVFEDRECSGAWGSRRSGPLARFDSFAVSRSPGVRVT
jgi:hypothetical protein